MSALRLPLLGTCNQCGLCCTAEVNGQLVVCQHLKAVIAGGRVKPLGTPEASRCGVYERRVDGMRIAMVNGRGEAVIEATCCKDSWSEDQVILERGLGRGCSLTLAGLVTA